MIVSPNGKIPLPPPVIPGGASYASTANATSPSYPHTSTGGDGYHTLRVPTQYAQELCGPFWPMHLSVSIEKTSSPLNPRPAHIAGTISRTESIFCFRVPPF